MGVPVEPRVSSAITALGSENTEDVIIFRTASVEADTPRRRAVGEVEIILTDVPWSYLGMFRKPAAARASEQPELIPFRKDGVVVRPVRESAIGAAEAWINDVMDDPALLEYQTAESQRRGGRRLGGGVVACSGRGATRLDHATGHDCSTWRPAWSPDLVSRRPSGNRGTTERGAVAATTRRGRAGSREDGQTRAPASHRCRRTGRRGARRSRGGRPAGGSQRGGVFASAAFEHPDQVVGASGGAQSGPHHGSLEWAQRIERDRDGLSQRHHGPGGLREADAAAACSSEFRDQVSCSRRDGGRHCLAAELSHEVLCGMQDGHRRSPSAGPLRALSGALLGGCKGKRQRGDGVLDEPRLAGRSVRGGPRPQHHGLAVGCSSGPPVVSTSTPSCRTQALCSAGLGSLDSSELCVSEGLRLPRGTPQERRGDHHNHPRGSAGRGRRRQRGQAEKASATSSQDRPDGRHHCLKHAYDGPPGSVIGPIAWSGGLLTAPTSRVLLLQNCNSIEHSKELPISDERTAGKQPRIDPADPHKHACLEPRVELSCSVRPGGHTNSHTFEDRPFSARAGSNAAASPLLQLALRNMRV